MFLATTWVMLKVLRFAILIAQFKIISLYLFKVMSLCTNALIHSCEPLFIALVEIFFSKTVHLLLNSRMKFINVLEIFAAKLFLNFLETDRGRAGSDPVRTLSDQPTERVERLKDSLLVLPWVLMHYYGE